MAQGKECLRNQEWNQDSNPDLINIPDKKKNLYCGTAEKKNIYIYTQFH